MNNKVTIEDKKIKCSIHGKTNETMSLAVRDKDIGIFCFYCYNDFLIKNLPKIEKIKG